VRKQTWPEAGIKYSYEDRYIKTEKLALWLSRAFGRGKGKYIVSWMFLPLLACFLCLGLVAASQVGL
jgi:hypothetical protein